LGKLIGVKKTQISRLENKTSNVTMDTLLRVFTALKARVKLQVVPVVNCISSTDSIRLDEDIIIA
jgi:transcriptional regulator with XRE-family HTH domain